MRPIQENASLVAVKLPVHEVEQEIRSALRGDQSRVLLKAPTGSGKSTAVPEMVRAEVDGQVIVVQPRRMAARLLAHFVAGQLGTSLGKGVGYAIRFEKRASSETEILFVTDGVLQRMLIEDPDLSGVGAVIFDEFHERRLASDLSLARILDLQQGSRPELRVVVMSATLEVGDLARYLRPCHFIETGGRLYPVESIYRAEKAVTRRGPMQKQELWHRVASAIQGEFSELMAGERILVFLPGLYEIRKTQTLLESLAWMKEWDIKPLYSALSPEAQKQAIVVDDSKRIILSTNVAETSLTIEGVKVVVDSGLARQLNYDVNRGFNSLGLEKISRAAAEQRAGRAGRMGPGRCIRLWSEADHRGRRSFEVPEILRVDFTEAFLFLKQLGVDQVSEFRWLDPPEQQQLKDAQNMLESLGAIDGEGLLTSAGREMARLPMHPRLSALILAGENCLGEVLFVAAAVQCDGVFKKGGKGPRWFEFLEGELGWRNDFAAEWLAILDALRVNFSRRDCDRMGILASGARETWKVFCQLKQMMEKRGQRVHEPDLRQRGEDCAKAMMLAFADRLAVRRDQGSKVCHVVGERSGKLDSSSCVRDEPFFLATDLTEIEGRERVVKLTRCVALDHAWIDTNEILHQKGVIFDELTRRVVSVEKKVFRGLILESKKGGEVDPDLAGALLAQRVIAGELDLKQWDAKVERWIARLVFLRGVMPELELPDFNDDDREMVIGQICSGATTYKEVKNRDPWIVLRDWLSKLQIAALDQYAPEKIQLVNGINTKVMYSLEQDPWIEEKVQRLYGVSETPKIAQGFPLVVKILAPNQRAWQITRDLPGFWENGFLQMKKDLAGRYPKHDWR